MLNIDRFMLSTLIMCLFNIIMLSNKFYNNLNINFNLIELLKKDNHISLQK
jgi:hypothetical protein